MINVINLWKLSQELKFWNSLILPEDFFEGRQNPGAYYVYGSVHAQARRILVAAAAEL